MFVMIMYCEEGSLLYVAPPFLYLIVIVLIEEPAIEILWELQVQAEPTALIVFVLPDVVIVFDPQFVIEISEAAIGLEAGSVADISTTSVK
jgi:hypothetical protein